LSSRTTTLADDLTSPGAVGRDLLLYYFREVSIPYSLLFIQRRMAAPECPERIE
jgi:hypothetical protein